jgi:hypothetical protein
VRRSKELVRIKAASEHKRDAEPRYRQQHPLIRRSDRFLLLMAGFVRPWEYSRFSGESYYLGTGLVSRCSRGDYSLRVDCAYSLLSFRLHGSGQYLHHEQGLARP